MAHLGIDTPVYLEPDDASSFTAVMPKALKNAGSPKKGTRCPSLPPRSVSPGVFCLEAEKHSKEMVFTHKNTSHHNDHGLLIS